MSAICLNEVRSVLREADLTANACMDLFPDGVDERNKTPAIRRICNGKIEQPPLLSSIMPDPKAVLRMRLTSRLLVDHAGGVLENAHLCLHRHFSCPIIPGSAVKGIARHQAWLEWDERLKGFGDDNPGDLAGDVADLFGFPTGDQRLDNALIDAGLFKKEDHQSGSVVFLPAFPVNIREVARVLEPDILNPHGRGNPIPVYFPAVAAGLKFEFVILPARRTSAVYEDVFDQARILLKRGLIQHGIGAKTNAGYGCFEEVKDV